MISLGPADQGGRFVLIAGFVHFPEHLQQCIKKPGKGDLPRSQLAVQEPPSLLVVRCLLGRLQSTPDIGGDAVVPALGVNRFHETG